MFDHITAVVLAGGRSSRMGKNKALLSFQGRPLIETIIEILQAIFPRVVLSVATADSYPGYSLAKIPDRYPEVGPIGAIASSLEALRQKIFCVACDMPYLNSSLIEFQCSILECDAVIPVWRTQLEGLHALYSPSLLGSFQAAISQNRLRLSDVLLGGEHIRYLQEDEIKKFDPQGLSFRNINTPHQYLEID
jgi:molybdopterin-guanine dinucleotide biosynthesis protein A